MAVTFPDPGDFLVNTQERAEGSSNPGPFALPEDSQRDPRVLWANKVEATLKQERSKVTREMKRNNDLYDGLHWTFPRAPWKNSSYINYTAWVADQWASILADNKPKTTFESYHLKDHDQAEILSAAFEDEYSRGHWQGIIENAVLVSRIEKVAYLRLDYDSDLYGGQGGAKLTMIPGSEVYVDRMARNVEDAVILYNEYYLTTGEILKKYKHLRHRIRTPLSVEEPEPNKGADQMLVGPNAVTLPSGTVEHWGPFTAPPSPPADQGTQGNKVREFWTRPKGPESQTTVTRIVWTAQNKPACRKRYLRMKDGLEALMTVVMENGTIYELPLTMTMALQAANIPGMRVLAAHNALEVVTEKKKVPLYPTGRRLVIVGDFVADDGCNPYGHGRWPFIKLDAYRTRNGYYGASDIDRISPLQEYLNRLYALLLDAAILTSNPIWLIPTESQLADEDITNAPGAIIRGEMALMKTARREAGPNMPAYVKDLLGFTIQQIREISGLSESATGGKFKGQQAAETVSMYQEAAGVRFRQAIRNLEEAMVELGYQFKGIVQQFYSQPRLMRIKNSQGLEIPTSYLGTSLNAPMMMKAKAGSMLPTSPSARLNYYMNLIGTPLMDLPEIWRVMQEYGLIDSASAIEKRMTKYLQTPGEMWKAPGLMQLLMGGQKKKAGSQQKKGNAGRSARAKTPSQAVGNM